MVDDQLRDRSHSGSSSREDDNWSSHGNGNHGMLDESEESFASFDQSRSQNDPDGDSDTRSGSVDVRSEALDTDASGAIEVSIQSILSPAIEATAWRVRSLRESQVALSSQLNVLTTRLLDYDEKVEPISLKHTVELALDSRKRLYSVCLALEGVERRLAKIKDRLAPETM